MLNMEANIDPSELQPLGEYDFEKNFNHRAALKWMEENWQKSLTISVIYLILIFGIQHFMKEQRPFKLRGPLILWSFSLSLFSLVAAFRIWKQLAFLLLTKGFKQSVCSQSFYVHPVSKLWIYLFGLSKLVEMGDTLFIVLRKKKLIFLHWYHHFATMILTWYGYTFMAAGAGWNTAINLSIHAVMYLYYSVAAMGIRVPSSITMLITSSQIVQIIGYVIMNIFIFFWKDDKLCPFTWPMLLLSSGLYTSLLVLFSNFFVKTYLSSTQKSKRN
ncbi:very long chain fatty acid elongase 3 [Zonotrichia albicollis]|uniref:very long chain fatty acid elongase 3 n=1 Tax=Zonotrichia albicollis TaxID=44394 RepID=UPI003D810C6E